MDEDRLKAAIDELVDRAKSQMGEWTIETAMQVEGLMRQFEGKIESGSGLLQEGIRDVKGSLSASAVMEE